MKFATLAVAAVLAGVPAVPAHEYEQTFTIQLACGLAEGLDTGLFALVESVAPGTIPNGLCYYVIRSVQGGDFFSIRPHDGYQDLVVGTADECPGPDTFDPTNPEWWLNDFWLLCRNDALPDWDIRFTGGEYGNGPGDEAGIVPGDGDAVVWFSLGHKEHLFGPETFVYGEA